MTEEHRVLVCGGRDYDDIERVYGVLDAIHTRLPITHIISGGASGADSIGEAWSDERPVYLLRFPAAWTDLETPPVVKRYRRDGTAYNAAAGGIRNQRMLDEGKPHLVVAFPGGSGTADMVRRALKAGVAVTDNR